MDFSQPVQDCSSAEDAQRIDLGRTNKFLAKSFYRNVFRVLNASDPARPKEDWFVFVHGLDMSSFHGKLHFEDESEAARMADRAWRKYGRENGLDKAEIQAGMNFPNQKHASSSSSSLSAKAVAAALHRPATASLPSAVSSRGAFLPASAPFNANGKRTYAQISASAAAASLPLSAASSPQQAQGLLYPAFGLGGSSNDSRGSSIIGSGTRSGSLSSSPTLSGLARDSEDSAPKLRYHHQQQQHHSQYYRQAQGRLQLQRPLVAPGQGQGLKSTAAGQQQQQQLVPVCALLWDDDDDEDNDDEKAQPLQAAPPAVLAPPLGSNILDDDDDDDDILRLRPAAKRPRHDPLPSQLPSTTASTTTTSTATTSVPPLALFAAPRFSSSSSVMGGDNDDDNDDIDLSECFDLPPSSASSNAGSSLASSASTTATITTRTAPGTLQLQLLNAQRSSPASAGLLETSSSVSSASASSLAREAVAMAETAASSACLAWVEADALGQQSHSSSASALSLGRDLASLAGELVEHVNAVSDAVASVAAAAANGSALATPLLQLRPGSPSTHSTCSSGASSVNSWSSNALSASSSSSSSSSDMAALGLGLAKQQAIANASSVALLKVVRSLAQLRQRLATSSLSSEASACSSVLSKMGETVQHTLKAGQLMQQAATATTTAAAAAAAASPAVPAPATLSLTPPAPLLGSFSGLSLPYSMAPTPLMGGMPMTMPMPWAFPLGGR